MPGRRPAEVVPSVSPRAECAFRLVVSRLAWVTSPERGRPPSGGSLGNPIHHRTMRARGRPTSREITGDDRHEAKRRPLSPGGGRHLRSSPSFPRPESRNFQLGGENPGKLPSELTRRRTSVPRPGASEIRPRKRMPSARLSLKLARRSPQPEQFLS